MSPESAGKRGEYAVSGGHWSCSRGTGVVGVTSGMVRTAVTPLPSTSESPILLVGIPRAGTTWSSRVLAAGGSLYPVMEPDNESRSAPALRAKRRAGRFPVLQPGDRDDAFLRLWSWALDGAPQSPRLKAAGKILRSEEHTSE